jgi:hypothetical protein
LDLGRHRLFYSCGKELPLLGAEPLGEAAPSSGSKKAYVSLGAKLLFYPSGRNFIFSPHKPSTQKSAFSTHGSKKGSLLPREQNSLFAPA